MATIYKPRPFPAIDGGEKTYLTSEFSRISVAMGDLDSSSAALEARATALEALPACFFAHKNGTDQTGVADSVPTLMTFGTERFDVGGHFASNAWVPPAGKVFLNAQFYISGTIAAGSLGSILIYKNGLGQIAQANHGTGTNFTTSGITFVDTANGSDSYTAYCYADLTSGTGTVLGTATFTYFCGFWISA